MMDDTNAEWQFIPGILQLVEEGIQAEDLANYPYATPRVRGPGRLEQVWSWLRGFRSEAALCERLPIWVPLVSLWPPPSGDVKFNYERSASTGGGAEITVLSAVGFGGGSQLKLTDAVQVTAQDQGLTYLTRAFLTIIRYRHQESGETMDRVDVDCSGSYAEFKHQELSPLDYPFYETAPSISQIEQSGYSILRVEYCSRNLSKTAVSFGRESLRSWKAKLGPSIPQLSLQLTLEITCERAEAFEAEFSLPPGQDYAFCVPKGESPLVPLCVPISEEGD
jgi:hypothetical protein